jgi:rhodanese-related sulfurtransferase
MSPASSSSITSNTPSTARTARELVACGAVLLDVRSPEEFRGGHVPGALNVPLHELAARLDAVGPRERAVVVYCRSGRRSAEAAQLLRRCGFRQVHDMGSMLEWANER